MSLTELLKAISGIEGNGGELKAFLQQLLSEKDASITTAESLANSAESKLNSIAKSLDCGADTILEKIKGLKTASTKLDEAQAVETELKTKLVEAEKAKKALERTTDLKDFCNIVGADFKAVSKLLPSDVQFKTVTTKGEKDQDVTNGVIVVDNKEVAFADYVDQDENLKTFRSSIFVQQANPPAPTGKLPTGKSPDTLVSPAKNVTASLVQQQKARAARLLESKK